MLHRFRKTKIFQIQILNHSEFGNGSVNAGFPNKVSPGSLMNYDIACAQKLPETETPRLMIRGKKDVRQVLT